MSWLLVRVGAGVIALSSAAVTAWEGNAWYLDTLRVVGRPEPRVVHEIIDCRASASLTRACFVGAILTGDYDEADRRADSALAAGSSFLGIWVAQTSEKMLRAGKGDDALKIARILIHHGRTPIVSGALVRGGKVCARVGAVRDAVLAFDRADALSGARFGEGWYQETLMYYERHEWDEVIRVSGAAVSASDGPELPMWRRCMDTLARSYAQLGRFRDAHSVYERIVQAYPKSRDWPVFQALSYLAEDDAACGDLASAASKLADSIDIALDLPPSARAAYESSAWRRLGHLFNGSSNEPGLTAVVSGFEKSFLSGRSTAGLYLVTGRLFQVLRRDGEARDAYVRGCALACGATPPNGQCRSVFLVAQPECSSWRSMRSAPGQGRRK